MAVVNLTDADESNIEQVFDSIFVSKCKMGQDKENCISDIKKHIIAKFLKENPSKNANIVEDFVNKLQPRNNINAELMGGGRSHKRRTRRTRRMRTRSRKLNKR